MSDFKSYGTWVGLYSDGRVNAAYVVTERSAKYEKYAREYVMAGSSRVVRVGPEVVVRLLKPLPVDAVIETEFFG